MLESYINASDPLKVYVPALNSGFAKITYQGLKNAVDYTLENFNKTSVQSAYNLYISYLDDTHVFKSDGQNGFKKALDVFSCLIAGYGQFDDNNEYIIYVTNFFYSELIQNFYGTQTVDTPNILPHVFFQSDLENTLNGRFNQRYKAELIEDPLLLATIFASRLFLKEQYKKWTSEQNAVVLGLKERDQLGIILNICNRDEVAKEYSKAIVGLIGQRYSTFMIDENANEEARKLSRQIMQFGEKIYGQIDFNKIKEVDQEELVQWAEDLKINADIMNATSTTNEARKRAILSDEPVNGIKYIVPEVQYADYILDDEEVAHTADEIAPADHEDILESHQKYARIHEPVESVRYLIDQETGERYFPEDFSLKDHTHNNEGFARVDELSSYDAQYILGEEITDTTIKGVLQQLTENKQLSSIEYINGLPYLSNKTTNKYYRLYVPEDFADINHVHPDLMSTNDIPIGAERFFDNITGNTYGMEDFAEKTHTVHYDNDGTEIYYLSKQDRARASFRLNGKDISYFALNGHDHNDRYYTKDQMNEKFRKKNNIQPADKYVSGFNIYIDNAGTNSDSIEPTQIRIGTKTLGPGESYTMPYESINFIHITVVGDIDGGGLPIQGDDEEIYYDENGIERKRRRIKLMNPTNAYLTYNYLVGYKMI